MASARVAYLAFMLAWACAEPLPGGGKPDPAFCEALDAEVQRSLSAELAP